MLWGFVLYIPRYELSGYTKVVKNILKKAVVSSNSVRAALIMCLCVMLINTLMLTLLIPQLDGRTFDFYLPARTGGKTFYLDESEFSTLSIVTLVIIGALTFFSLYSHHFKRFQHAYVSASVALTAGVFYLATLLGNVFDAFWGGVWSVVGVAVGILVGIILGASIHYYQTNSRSEV